VNISLLLDVVAAMAPDHVAAKDAERELTLAQLRIAARALAQRFRELDRPGDVAFMDTNSVAVAVTLFAASYAGRTFVPLNYRADGALVAYYVDTLKPPVVIVGDRYRELFDDLAPTWDVSGLFEPIAPPDDDFDDGLMAAPAVRIFTSGTTSAPKAATLHHANLAAYVLSSTDPLGEAGGTTLIATPNYHIATVATVLTSTYAGRRMFFLDRFTPETWLAVAEREQVTHAFTVPTMLQRIVDALAAGAFPPPELRTLAYGGSAAARSTVEGALRHFDPATGFVNAYGLTETSSTLTVLGPDDHRAAIESDDTAVRDRLTSVGRPLPGVEIDISGEGEILVRGAQVSGTYGRDDEVDDQWFHTGDLGHMDDGGYLFIDGRIDDMIIRGGENISPLEIEDALLRSPEVRAAAVVGVSDPEWGQRVLAAVELRAPVESDELRERLVSLLPSFKRPEQIVIVDELPRTDLGKLQRRKVRAWLESEAGRDNPPAIKDVT
jgi:acyl-CoA synthetase (AMP-forming)/AMP-acid ligase II